MKVTPEEFEKFCSELDIELLDYQKRTFTKSIERTSFISDDASQGVSISVGRSCNKTNPQRMIFYEKLTSIGNA